MTKRVSRLADVQGAVPTAVRFHNGRVTVEWLPLPRSVLDFAFFQDGIEAYCRRSGTEPLRSGYVLLEALASETHDLPLTCAVAHISRCGSTLLGACIRELDNAIVLSEPPVVTALLRGIADGAVLRAVIARYAQHFLGSRLAIKLASTDTLRLRRFHECIPSARLLLLVRDPAEVAVSNLLRPGGFMRLRDNPVLAAQSLGIEAAIVRTSSEAQFCAQVLTSYLRALIDQEKHAVAVVDYSTLNSQTIALTVSLLLGDINAAERERVVARSMLDAKVPTRGTFHQDSERKRASATAALRSALIPATVLYEKLLAIRRTRNAAEKTTNSLHQLVCVASTVVDRHPAQDSAHRTMSPHSDDALCACSDSGEA